jgi:hypothetical protein
MADTEQLAHAFADIAERAVDAAERYRLLLQVALSVAAAETIRAKQAEAVAAMLRQDVRWRGETVPGEVLDADD